MPRTDFTPKKHGFHFPNVFANKIIKTKWGEIETKGRCGGMAFASLDYYFANIPIPAYGTKDSSIRIPPDGDFVADFIYKRLIDSFFTSTSHKFISWTLASDSPKFLSKGVSHWTKKKEFPKMKESIDKGIPVILGLVRSRNLKEIAGNHQVVAYGYDYNSINDKITIYIYDNNFPDQEVMLISDETIPHFVSLDKYIWRGFFVQDYKPKVPKES
jgi:hypothetical protein